MKKDNQKVTFTKEDLDILAQEDFDFISSKSKALLLKTPVGARYLMISIGLFLLFFLIWITFAETEEITTGFGRAIPETELHELHSMEGGIISELYVKAGDIVKADAPLLRVDATQQNSDLQEIKRQLDVLNAKKERLQAELDGSPLKFSAHLKKSIPKLLEKEEQLYNSRTRQYLASENYYNEKINQLNSEKIYTRKSLLLTKKELDATRPLLADRAISEIEVLKLENSYNELNSKYASNLIEIKALASQRDEELLSYRNETQELLSDVIGNIKIIKPLEVGAQDRVSKSIIRSPINGVVQRLLTATVGSAVQPGETIIEIIPEDDSLIIEARVDPSDRGFIEVGQKAMVKFAAFDFTIYGGLEGEIIHISPDAVIEDTTKQQWEFHEVETFYRVKVKTSKNFLGSNEKPLMIRPGMVAEIDILTGKKTILSFLLKPILRAKYNSLQER